MIALYLDPGQVAKTWPGWPEFLTWAPGQYRRTIYVIHDTEHNAWYQHAIGPVKVPAHYRICLDPETPRYLVRTAPPTRTAGEETK